MVFKNAFVDRRYILNLNPVFVVQRILLLAEDRPMLLLLLRFNLQIRRSVRKTFCVDLVNRHSWAVELLNLLDRSLNAVSVCKKVNYNHLLTAVVGGVVVVEAAIP